MMALEASPEARPVLQPACNRVPNLENHRKVVKKQPQSKPPSSSPAPPSAASLTFPSKTVLPKSSPCKPATKPSPPLSPKCSKPLASLAVLKRASAGDPRSLNSSIDKQSCSYTPIYSANNSGSSYASPPSAASTCTSGITSLKLSSSSPRLVRGRKKSKSTADALCDFSSILLKSPGSIAAARREQVSLLQAQRKQKIAHYGRTPKAGVKPLQEEPLTPTSEAQEHKKCNFITPNSDPIYVRYHDEEWGVPVHDDKMLFELLVLAGAQVKMDWTTILKMRVAFREAFDGFDAELIAKFSEKKIASVSTQLSIDASIIRGVVDNSKRVIEIKKVFGSLDNYIWGFVNHKPMCPEYRSCRKIPVKTSKSEGISKDMVKRNFRNVGPTVVHSFMQAAGLTNDHLVTCPRHDHCTSLATPFMSSSQ
ncbi:uncharacterized protein LOC116245868 [Nymphaea colorata]|nr:uncharacterized protein LOC116245868 [Nymphaea colorata]